MNNKKKLLLLVLGIFSITFVIKNLSGTMDLAAIATAQSEYETYYEIQMKLVWDRLYNLDLYVTEPCGDTASIRNTTTASGGELGYYDSDGEWQYGDSGNNTAPEVYRTEYGQEGIYDINVICNAYEIYTSDMEIGNINDFGVLLDSAGTITADELCHVSANAYVLVTLYGDSEEESFLRFPESGTEEVISWVNDGLWHAGSFDFMPIAKRPDPWEIRDPTECFIATAAYGSSLAPDVRVLCLFRDTCLVNSKPGRLLLKLYYKISPPLAKIIKKRGFLKFAARTYIHVIVRILKWTRKYS